jgi:hypothetical protein
MPIVWIIVVLMALVVVAAVPIVMVIIVSFMVVTMRVDNLLVIMVAHYAAVQTRHRQSCQAATRRQYLSPVRFHNFLPL